MRLAWTQDKFIGLFVLFLVFFLYNTFKRYHIIERYISIRNTFDVVKICKRSKLHNRCKIIWNLCCFIWGIFKRWIGYIFWTIVIYIYLYIYFILLTKLQWVVSIISFIDTLQKIQYLFKWKYGCWVVILH